VHIYASTYQTADSCEYGTCKGLRPLAFSMGGESTPLPPLPPSPTKPKKVTRPEIRASDKANSIPKSISIPAKQFENFEQSLNKDDVCNSSSPQDCVTVDQVSLANGSREATIIPRARLIPPLLINSNVENFEEPMDIDSVSRKRTMPCSSDSNKSKDSKKKHTIANNTPRDSPSLINKENKLYTSTDCPPFLIHVHSVSEGSLNPTHPLLISRTLSHIAYSDIKEIKKLGRGKVLVELTSAKSANNLILNPKLAEENLKAFVPTYRTIRSGIIKDIPQHYEEGELLEFLDSPFKVVEVRRLNRRLRVDGETKYVPSRTVCLKFAGQILPKYVYLCRNRFEVSPFVPKIKICYSCYRVGHISKACKGKPRCIFCGGDPHGKDNENDVCPERDNPPKCINCQGEHLASSHTCPTVSQHKKVIALSAIENIPFVEARRRLQRDSSFIPSDPRYDFVNYPLLNPRNTHHDSYQSIASNVVSNFTYSNNRFAALGSLNSSCMNSHTAENGNTNNNNSFRTSYNTPPSTRSSEGRVFPTQRRTQPQSRETKFLPRPNRNGFRNEDSQISDPFCCPNGRSPNLSGNGVGYGSNIDSTSQESPKCSSHPDSPYQREYFSQAQLSSPIAGNRCNTNNNYKDIDIETLNLSILKLIDSVGLIHKLFLSLNSSGNILESSLNLSQNS